MCWIHSSNRRDTQGASPRFRMCIKIETGDLGEVVQAGGARVKEMRAARPSPILPLPPCSSEEPISLSS